MKSQEECWGRATPDVGLTEDVHQGFPLVLVSQASFPEQLVCLQHLDIGDHRLTAFCSLFWMLG